MTNDFNHAGADIYINSTCNLTCSTCFLGDKYFDNGLQMSLDDVRRIVHWCANHGVSNIAVLGGEPTLHRDIGEIVRAIKSMDMQTRLVTNGNRRFRRMLPELSLSVDLFYLSIDGVDEAGHDAVRGKGSFRDVLESLKALDEVQSGYVITYTATSSKLSSVRDMVDFACNTGCSRLNIHFPTKIGRGRDLDVQFDPLEWMQVAAYLRCYKKPRQNLVVDFQIAYSKLSDIEADYAHRFCRVSNRSNIQFMPGGRVVSCGLLADNYCLFGYDWDGRNLVARSGETEISICHSNCSGCPLRKRYDLDFAVDSPSTLVPVCIYEKEEM